MSTNETLIAVPLDIANPEQLRQFLVKLIVALDIELGFRRSAVKEENQVELLTELSVEPVITAAELQHEVIANRNKINELINSLNAIGVL